MKKNVFFKKLLKLTQFFSIFLYFVCPFEAIWQVFLKVKLQQKIPLYLPYFGGPCNRNPPPPPQKKMHLITQFVKAV